MIKMTILYRHIRLDKNEPFYIGIGSLERAHTKHSRNKYWKNIVNKSEYRVDILFDDLTWEEACEKEIEFIKLYGRKDLGTGTLVNMTDGGEGICNPSDESRLKISKALKGRKYSDETKLKMSEAQIGRKASNETKQKMSEAHTGEKNSFFGKNHNDETKKKMSEAHTGKKHSEDRKNNRKKSIRDIHSEKNVGVFFNTKQNRWISRIYVDGVQYYLGSFINYEDALKARKDAENIYW